MKCWEIKESVGGKSVNDLTVQLLYKIEILGQSGL